MLKTSLTKRIPRPASCLILSSIVLTMLLSTTFADEKRPPSPPDLSGKWQLNHKLSENPGDKMREAMAKGGPGDSPGGMPPPGGGGFPGPPTGEGGPGGRRGGFGRGPRVFGGAEKLEILQHEPELTINETGDSDVVRTRTIYTDGRKAEQSGEFGGKAETKAKWKGNKLVVETKTERGKLTETYELASGVQQLYITTKIEDEHFPEPISFRRVYDRQSDN